MINIASLDVAQVTRFLLALGDADGRALALNPLTRSSSALWLSYDSR